MTNSRVRLAEALAILGTLAATAKGQEIERLDALSTTRMTLPLRVSESGEWIGGLDFGIDYGIAPVRWRRGQVEVESLAESSASGVGLVSLDNDGRIFGIDNTRIGAWTSVGFEVLYPEGNFFGAVTRDGVRSVVFRWDTEPYRNWIYQGTTPIRGLANPSDEFHTVVTGVSAGCRVVVGTTFVSTTINNVSSDRYFPARWVDGELMPLPTGVGWSVNATGVSDDGTVIGGSTNDVFEHAQAVPLIWIGQSGPFPVGPAGGHAIPMSRDGRIVKAGLGIWMPQAGYRSDSDFLVQMGISEDQLPGVQIWDCSGDGTAMSVSLRNSDGARMPFRITLPPACHLDYATDGMVDFFDYVAFVACFEGDCPNYRSADFNMDGFVDWTDYAGFVGAFEIGC